MENYNPYEKIQEVVSNDSLSRAQVFRWRETVEDEPRSGRLASVRTRTNVDHVRTFISQDGRLIIRIIADELDINEHTAQQIVTQDLNMRKLRAKMFPKNLNDDRN
jgi:hypothetical protein